MCELSWRWMDGWMARASTLLLLLLLLLLFPLQNQILDRSGESLSLLVSTANHEVRRVCTVD